MIKKPSWREQGEDPDYRFSLANERTFLAWIRTSLALLAAAVLLDQLEVSHPQALAKVVAVGLVLVAGCFAGLAYFRWRANEIAMRNRVTLPHSITLLVAALLLIAISVTIGALVLA
jgi:putative membrane protein